MGEELVGEEAEKYVSGEGFDPKLSSAGEDTLAEFIRAPLKGNLQEVPEIGPKNEEKFKVHGINTTYQLVALLLSFKEEDTDAVEMCDKFWYSLQALKVYCNRNTIVQCIAEKVDTWVAGVYDSDLYT